MSDYRYGLTRDVSFGVPAGDGREELGGGQGQLLWVMLNPSTADEYTDDATIRRVKRFTIDHGFKSLMVVNLFALRATYPRDLLRSPDPIGPLNGEVLRSSIEAHEHVVFAWGASWSNLVLSNPRRFGRLKAASSRPNVEAMARKYGRKPLCLGLTKHREPLHPLRLHADTELGHFFDDY